MSETSPRPLVGSTLAQRLAEAARATASRATPVGRCSAPVAVDPWGAVSERCPLPPGHDDGHEIESEIACRERLARAAGTHPGQVLIAADAVVAWLAEPRREGLGPPPPVRELWTLIEFAEAMASQAMASLDAPIDSAAPDLTGVVTDG